MSFVTVTCQYCRTDNTTYGRIIPLCPKCGGGCDGTLPVMRQHPLLKGTKWYVPYPPTETTEKRV